MNSNKLFFRSVCTLCLGAIALACSSTTTTPTNGGSSGSPGTSTSPTVTCSDACTHAAAACAQLTADMCNSGCGSLDQAQLGCLAKAKSCEDVRAAGACKGTSTGGPDGGTGGGVEAGAPDSGSTVAKCTSDSDCGKTKCVCKSFGNIACQGYVPCNPSYQAVLDAHGCQTNEDYCRSECSAYGGYTGITNCPP